jgi:hypothetical protein
MSAEPELSGSEQLELILAKLPCEGVYLYVVALTVAKAQQFKQFIETKGT